MYASGSEQTKSYLWKYKWTAMQGTIQILKSYWGVFKNNGNFDVFADQLLYLLILEITRKDSWANKQI